MPEDRRYSESMHNLFIGQLDGKMDGNHSLLTVVSHLIPCADAQAPLIINIVLGLPANMCVMWLILAGPGDKAAEMFSLNQAVCELAICMENVILLIATNTTYNAVHHTYLWSTIRFSLGFMFVGRPLFTSCVCFERYLAVVHPVTFLKYKLLRYRLAGTLTSWLTVLVGCIILTWVPHQAICYVSFGMAFTWFPVQLFCCVETLRRLLRPRPGERNQESNGVNSSKQKAVRIIIIIAVSAALIYVPFLISIILLAYSLKEYSSKLFCIITYIALVTGFIPPLLYINRAGKLQHCFQDTAT